MRKNKKKGFTLVELLAVIVILAILLAIAVPAVTKYITKSRKDGMIATTQEFADAIRNDATSEFYDFPIANNDITIVSIDLIKLEKGKRKSSFNGRWLPRYSYVAVINTGTEDDPDYEYFIAVRDSKRYTITLSKAEDITRESIKRSSSTDTTTNITSMCGSEDGEYMVIDKIVGLEKYQPVGGWNATVYSSEGC